MMNGRFSRQWLEDVVIVGVAAGKVEQDERDLTKGNSSLGAKCCA